MLRHCKHWDICPFSAYRHLQRHNRAFQEMPRTQMAWHRLPIRNSIYISQQDLADKYIGWHYLSSYRDAYLIFPYVIFWFWQKYNNFFNHKDWPQKKLFRWNVSSSSNKKIWNQKDKSRHKPKCRCMESRSDFENNLWNSCNLWNLCSRERDRAPF